MIATAAARESERLRKNEEESLSPTHVHVMFSVRRGVRGPFENEGSFEVGCFCKTIDFLTTGIHMTVISL